MVVQNARPTDFSLILPVLMLFVHLTSLIIDGYNERNLRRWYSSKTNVSPKRRNLKICALTCPVKLGQQPQFVLSCDADAASKVASQSARNFAVTVQKASIDKLPGRVSSLRKSTVVNNPAVATAECVSSGTVNVS